MCELCTKHTLCAHVVLPSPQRWLWARLVSFQTRLGATNRFAQRTSRQTDKGRHIGAIVERRFCLRRARVHASCHRGLHSDQYQYPVCQTLWQRSYLTPCFPRSLFLFSPIRTSSCPSLLYHVIYKSCIVSGAREARPPFW